MSEMAELTPVVQQFIVHWGEMGERWGINRTVAQIHALLYLSPEPINAEQISAALAVARSTVSAGLRELQSWGIISIVHRLGDRTDYFTAMGDIWEMFRVIVDRRKHLELDPTLEMLRGTVKGLENSNEDPRTQEKMAAMLDLFETASELYAQIQRVPTRTLVRLARTADVVGKVLGVFPE